MEDDKFCTQHSGIRVELDVAKEERKLLLESQRAQSKISWAIVVGLVIALITTILNLVMPPSTPVIKAELSSHGIAKGIIEELMEEGVLEMPQNKRKR